MSLEATKALSNVLMTKLKGYEKAAHARDMTLGEFFSKRVYIKDFHNNIVSLKPKPIQLQHLKAKQDAIAQGKPPRFLLLKYRRGGFTTWEQATSYRTLMTQANSSCVTLAHTKPDTQTIFRMVSLMSNRDPERPGSIGESKSHIEVPSLGSIFYIGTAGAKAFGRGDNLTRVHGSEVAFWQGDEYTIDNLIAGLEEAARYGEVVLETTANGAQGWFYEKYKEAMEGENNYTPLFYPWFMDAENTIDYYSAEDQTEFFDTITKEEREFMDVNDLTLGQMLWRRMKQKDRKKLFPQEYPENWTEAFIVRGDTFFDPTTIDRHSRNASKPIKEGENVTIWKNPEPGREYCAGADPAEGNPTSDNSVMGILDRETGEQVAVLRGKWRPEVFARKCIELCTKYNKAMYCCERNNHGHSVLNTVINTLNYKNIYKWKKPIDKNKYGTDKVEHIPGYDTNKKTRPILLDDLNEALEEDFMIVNDTVFLAECKTFVDEGGKWQADKDEHDDSIMAWGMAWQARKQKRKSYIVT